MSASAASRLTQPPSRGPVGFWMLLAGAAAAPIFWLGQLMLAYLVSSGACFGSDHPTRVASAEPLLRALTAFDATAIALALAGLAISRANLRRANLAERSGQDGAAARRVGRSQFLSVWGVLSSACFLAASLFNTIASVVVPPCVR